MLARQMWNWPKHRRSTRKRRQLSLKCKSQLHWRSLAATWIRSPRQRRCRPKCSCRCRPMFHWLWNTKCRTTATSDTIWHRKSKTTKAKFAASRENPLFPYRNDSAYSKIEIEWFVIQSHFATHCFRILNCLCMYCGYAGSWMYTYFLLPPKQ